MVDLFSFLDANDDKTCEPTELANILILLCKGDKPSKIEAAFHFYDKDNSQSLNIHELTDYLIGVLKIQWRAAKSSPNGNPNLKYIDEKSLMKIAAATASRSFKQIDLDGNGSLSLKEFVSYIENGGKMDESLKLSIENNKAKKGYVSKAQRSVNINEAIRKIDKVRAAIPLERVHISVAMKLLLDKNPQLQAIDKKKFREFLKYLVKKTKIKVKFKDAFDTVPGMVYEVFDLNSNGIMDASEVGMTLFILCGK
jgi:Ca2+-binding EF-hand superfamily protein